MAELDEIYSPRILEIAGNIPHSDRLPDPHVSVTKSSKLCGSTVTIDLKMRGDIVSDFAQDVKACLLGQTSAAVLGRNIVGANVQELRDVAQTMRAMLKENGPPPTGKWEDLQVLEPVRDYKARHTSTLLVFDAVEEAINLIEQQQQQQAQ